MTNVEMEEVRGGSLGGRHNTSVAPPKYEQVINISQDITYQPERNRGFSCFLGCIFGLMFNVFGLICIGCVTDKMWYLLGFVFPCIMTAVLAIVFLSALVPGLLIIRY